MSPRLFLFPLLALAMSQGSQSPVQESVPRGRPLVQLYGPEVYRGIEQVRRVIQGEAGWIWLLTPVALHSFDGNRWRRFPLPREAGRHLCMAPLAGGGVVLGSEGHLASCAPGPRGELRYRNLLEEAPDFQARLGRIKSLERTKGGYYFIDSMRFGFFRIDTKTGLAVDLRVFGKDEKGQWKSPPIFYFKEIEGKVWLQFHHGGLGRLGKEGPELVPGGEFFAERPFGAIEKRGSGLLIATYTKGLFLFENGVARPWKTEASEICRVANPSGLSRLSSGLYVLSTRSSGLIFFDAQGRVHQTIDVDRGLPSNNIWSEPGLDHQNGLWVPTNNGAARLQLDGDLTIFDREDGLEGDIADLEIIQGRLHVLTDQGVFRVRSPRSQNEPSFEALPRTKAPPTQLASLGDSLLVGTERGLFSFDAKTNLYTPLAPMDTRALETDREKEWIFIGSRGWGLVLLHKQGGRWTIHESKNPSQEVCDRVILDASQDAWAHIVDRQGGHKLERVSRASGYRKIQEIKPPKGAPEGVGGESSKISDFYSYKGFIHIRMGDRHYRWQQAEGLFVRVPTDEIPGLAFVGTDKRPLNSREDLRWFLGTNRDIYLYQKDIRRRAEVWRPLLRVQDARWNCELLDSNAKELWAGGYEGRLVRCKIADPTIFPPPSQRPMFSSIRIVDYELIHGGYGPLPRSLSTSPSEQNHYRFAWSLPAFEGPDRVRYRTRLTGLEDAWTGWSKQVDREFLSLPPGDYKFEIQARDPRGRLSTSPDFPFRIMAPWYKSAWATVLFILCGGLILFSLVSWRNQRVRLRVQRLETEIRQRETAERELEESQRRYRSLVETTSDLVWEMDAEFCYLYASPRFEDQLGYQESELIGRSIFDLIEPEDQARVRAQFDYSKQAGTPFSGIQFEVHEKTGRKRRMESNGVPVFDESGRVLGFRGIDRDVTERLAAEDERRELEDRLRQSQKLESLGRLAGGVSHDFNNILTAILGHAELVRDFCKPGTKMPEKLYSSIEEILRAGRQAADLTGRLLAFSRQQILRPRIVDPAQVLFGLERMLQRLIREDIEIILDLAPDAGSILVDGGQLEQVIINLVVNAVDAMPDGGMLTLCTERVTIDKPHVALHPGTTEGIYVRISVKDTGHGMDQETQRRIFEPFFTTKDPGKGTGLGLASTHGIVKQSGGHINLESELGKGSTFQLYFPVVTGKSQEHPPEEHLQSVDGSENILVCDDDLAVRSVAESCLVAHGYRVTTASHAKEALSLLEASDSKIDVLITDLIMPGMNGKELAKQVRSQYPELAVLFASGYRAEITIDQSTFPPRTNFLPKPFTSQDLLQHVRQLMDG